MICPNCNIKMNFREGGYSQKKQKAYKAFYSCPNRECGYTCDAEEQQAAPSPRPAAKPAAAAPAAPAGNPRLHAACAAIQAACMLRSGTQMPIDQVLNDAATIYFQFLKPSAIGEPPESFERGPDSDPF